MNSFLCMRISQALLADSQILGKQRIWKLLLQLPDEAHAGLPEDLLAATAPVGKRAHMYSAAFGTGQSDVLPRNIVEAAIAALRGFEEQAALAATPPLLRRTEKV
jgi:hypothetical protein